jgi:hypothetical protein
LRLQNDRSGAVLPDALQRELEPAIGALLETVLSHGRARDVVAEALELLSVAPVHALARVQVDAAHLGDGIVVVVAARGGLPGGRDDEAERGLSGALPGDGDSSASRGRSK